VLDISADLAVLTNGITWWFYVAHEKGTWQQKSHSSLSIVLA